MANKKKSLTNSEKERIYQLYTVDGKTQQKIADFYDVSQSTIHQVIKEKRYEEEIGELKQTIQNAAAAGFEARLRDCSIQTDEPPHALEEYDN